jgi:hypothetical protein
MKFSYQQYQDQDLLYKVVDQYKQEQCHNQAILILNKN